TALLSDVMIFERAVRCALDYNEFFDVKEFDKADALLAEGVKRAEQLQAGQPEWITQKGLVVRGYISRIDNTVQPYGMVIPPTYAIDHSVPSRCDIWFHGRGEKLSEVNFLWDRMHNPGEFTPDHTIMLHPYGRYCNAFKFAGEVDVLEALEDVQERYRIDEDRISVRGFSMGGAACWQFATHYADRWFAANPGAGFSETPQFLKVFQKEELKPTPWEQALWNLYDCDKWALNLNHCPTIAYSGENDSQKQAADVMEKALANQGIRLRHVIGKAMGHKFDAESKHVIGASLNELAKRGRNTIRQDFFFTTHSLRYYKADWVTVNALGEHWAPATLKAWMEHGPHGATLLTVGVFPNITDFTIQFPAGALSPQSVPVVVVLSLGDDGEPIAGPGGEEKPLELRVFSDGSFQGRFRRNAQQEWEEVVAEDTSLRKRHSLQGPIDDAFMDSFIFVRPTGTATNEAVGKWADVELTRAIEHWRRHFRGDARVVNDVDLTDEMIQSS
ncbi:MAG: prolyl oligopeptidase family serine peptidase, partial [Planctomycetaceae bacterium]|nr:prolyl oligopeptidase family serine peptidase [Planctomycetaceae bacterium]